MSFEEDENQALLDLKKRFPNTKHHQITDKFQQDALLIFQKDWNPHSAVKS
ncbi:MAG: hypothetical protein LEGION0403_FIIPPAGN_02735 [Legionella sp.]